LQRLKSLLSTTSRKEATDLESPSSKASMEAKLSMIVGLHRRSSITRRFQKFYGSIRSICITCVRTRPTIICYLKDRGSTFSLTFKSIRCLKVIIFLQSHCRSKLRRVLDKCGKRWSWGYGKIQLEPFLV
jgi:hypothetical protein